MRRYFKILALHFEHVFENRLRSFIWFVVTFFNPFLVILFWRGALTGNKEIAPGWNFTTLTSYYFLVVVAGAFLISHIEEDISEFDIRGGELVRYLVKPFPYYWIKLIEELPYRFLQGMYGVITLIILYLFFGRFITISHDPLTLAASILIMLFAAFISNTLKQILGLCALWVTDIRGLYEVLEVGQVIFAGFLIPIILLPAQMKTIANVLPFAYIIYYPVSAFIGQLNYVELLRVIGIQSFWLAGLIIIYGFVWRNGIKKFTAIGQ